MKIGEKATTVLLVTGGVLFAGILMRVGRSLPLVGTVLDTSARGFDRA
jgi:hypothetical protein